MSRVLSLDNWNNKLVLFEADPEFKGYKCHNIFEHRRIDIYMVQVRYLFNRFDPYRVSVRTIHFFKLI